MPVAVKYICPKCGRRFVDWGAEKLQFMCPTEECKGATLVLLGSNDEDQEERPTLKRSRKRKAVVPHVAPEIDIADMDGAFIESDVDDIDDDEEEEGEAELEEVVIVKSVVEEDVDDDALLEDDDAIEDEGDDTFADALDIEGDDIPLEEV